MHGFSIRIYDVIYVKKEKHHNLFTQATTPSPQWLFWNSWILNKLFQLHRVLHTQKKKKNMWHLFHSWKADIIFIASKVSMYTGVVSGAAAEIRNSFVNNKIKWYTKIFCISEYIFLLICCDNTYASVPSFWVNTLRLSELKISIFVDREMADV